MKFWALLLIVILCQIILIECIYLPSKNETKEEKFNFIYNYADDIFEKNVNKENMYTSVMKEKNFFSNVISFGFHMLNIKKVLREMKEGITSSATCLACKFGVGILQHLVQEGKSEDEIGHFADIICTTFKIETARVCKGITNTFKNEVVQVFAKVVLSPREICGILLGDKCAKVYDPYQNWTVPLPPIPKPPSKPIHKPKKNAPVIKVLHLSDTHFDQYYMEGSNAECNEPLCCRSADNQTINPDKKAGKWGDYRNCDTPLRTLENMLKHIVENHKIDYVIWTGDIPAHDVWNQTRAEQLYLLQSVSKIMMKYMKNIPVYPALGNHESFPVNSFPIPQIEGKDSISWLYNEIVTVWKPWLPSTVSSTLEKGAYYSIKVNPGFRIVSINMNYCNTQNWWLLINTTDPAQQLRWLVNELQTAELKGEKVHIIGHIPPGSSDCLRVWSRNYYKIIQRYNDTVTAQFFGHTHMDEFEVFYDTDTATAINVAYIGPSITTYNSVNPGYRIYTVDGNYANSSRVVLDHETYFLNLTEANLTDKPVWKFEYSAKKVFNMSSLLPSEWDKLLKRFDNDDKVFQQFYRYYRKMSDYYKDPCTDDCKTKLLCKLRNGQSGNC
ncbi:sphingomyelin phosphodiesterase-like [Centruroides vittatus]|uniref:sphingomyelin phosphodiesterase-like n=1 Tax=Centruroides vittatus TaxID=120091 RepID=UPI00350F1714